MRLASCRAARSLMRELKKNSEIELDCTQYWYGRAKTGVIWLDIHSAIEEIRQCWAKILGCVTRIFIFSEEKTIKGRRAVPKEYLRSVSSSTI